MSPDRLRADAARNREVVLAAADALFADAGSWDSVSMSTVAAAAGVGKGTVFRAFGDRGGLLRAVFARRSGALVAAVEAGEPPFAPDAPAADRVAALLDGLLTFKLAHRQLSLALDEVGSGSPYRAENYGWWHGVLAAALEPSCGGDADFLGHVLLASVRSDLLEHLVTTQGRTEDDVRAGVAALVTRVLS